MCLYTVCFTYGSYLVVYRFVFLTFNTIHCVAMSPSDTMPCSRRMTTIRHSAVAVTLNFACHVLVFLYFNDVLHSVEGLCHRLDDPAFGRGTVPPAG